MLLVLMLSACSGSAELHTRTALNTLAEIVDPAYEAAVAGCVAQEAMVMASARAGEISPAEARARLDGIMGPCLRITAAFDRIRSLHEKAAGLVEAGRLEQAEQLLIELRKAWGQLGGVHP